VLQKGYTSFLVTGDVYRKDEIDSKHYPVFHQTEMLTLIDSTLDPVTELKRILAGLTVYLFPSCEYRFNDDYFPFTHPSFEIEVKFRGNWLEILGCGVVQPAILENNGIKDKKAIAFGIGLERIAMIIADIPDIRYMWSTHERFLSQFSSGTLVKFQPYSELPSQTRDLSFFVPVDWTHENDFFELVREYSNDMLEEVKLLDTFHNKKTDKYSRTYRLTYSPNSPTAKDPGEFTKTVNDIQNILRDQVSEKLQVVMR
jgi:phenylalanyl-tRNA synthetase alpha chain